MQFLVQGLVPSTLVQGLVSMFRAEGPCSGLMVHCPLFYSKCVSAAPAPAPAPGSMCACTAPVLHVCLYCTGTVCVPLLHRYCMCACTAPGSMCACTAPVLHVCLYCTSIVLNQGQVLSASSHAQPSYALTCPALICPHMHIPHIVMCPHMPSPHMPSHAHPSCSHVPSHVLCCPLPFMPLPPPLCFRPPSAAHYPCRRSTPTPGPASVVLIPPHPATAAGERLHLGRPVVAALHFGLAAL